IPLPGHSVAVLVNGEINEETLKAYAKTFADNKLNYAFVGKQTKDITKEFGINETYDTTHPTLLDNMNVITDDAELSPDAEAFAELTYKHNKPLVVNQAASEKLSNAKLDLNAPGVYISDDAQTIIQAFERARYWDR